LKSSIAIGKQLVTVVAINKQTITIAGSAIIKQSTVVVKVTIMKPMRLLLLLHMSMQEPKLMDLLQQ
jgi:hypothetical protein